MLNPVLAGLEKRIITKSIQKQIKNNHIQSQDKFVNKY
jgi:hypothetical protein